MVLPVTDFVKPILMFKPVMKYPAAVRISQNHFYSTRFAAAFVGRALALGKDLNRDAPHPLKLQITTRKPTQKGAKVTLCTFAWRVISRRILARS